MRKIGLLQGLIAVSAALAIAGHYWPGDGRWVVYGFKPATTILILWLAAATAAVDLKYRRAIIVGLVFSLFGDVFLMLPGDWFLFGLASFLVAHVFYLVAFTRGVRFAGRWMPFAGYAVFGLAALASLWSSIPSVMRLPVLAYVLLLVSMASQAAVRAMVVRTKAAQLAAIGGGLFLLSDTLLAVNRFGGRFALSSLLVLGTYYAAQWLIAASIQQDSKNIEIS